MTHGIANPNAARHIVWKLLLCIVFAFLPAQSAVGASSFLTKEETHAIGVEAYLYLYPLVTMDITRRQSTNIAPDKELGRGPMNMFVNVRQYPPADFKDVVRPNFDTLYSVAWVDLTKEPQVVSVPDTNGRYYLLPMLDMWTDVFASPGWRTTGTQTGHYLLIPPGWRRDLGERPVGEVKLPNDVARIAAPTPYVWIIGRTKTDGPADYEAVHKIQDGFKITPLSQWGKAPVPVQAEVDPAVDMKTPPKVQVQAMTAGQFFAYAAQILKLQPPHITDQAILARMKRIGLDPGKGFDMATLDASVREGLADVPQDARRLMQWKTATLARVANGWSMNTDTMGVYGNYYLKRAVVADVGLGANQPEDAIYPLNLGDEKGRSLDGANTYRIHFDKGETPPVDAFWSITLYDPDGFQAANALNRFAISSWMPLAYNSDGSLDLYVQKESPGAGKEVNWLPAPGSAFNLTMRLYAPKSEALTGKWNPPPVVRVEGSTDSAK